MSGVSLGIQEIGVTASSDHQELVPGIKAGVAKRNLVNTRLLVDIFRKQRVQDLKVLGDSVTFL